MKRNKGHKGIVGRIIACAMAFSLIGALAPQMVVGTAKAAANVTIDVKAIGHGTVTPNGKQTISTGNSLEIVATPDSGYEIESAMFIPNGYEPMNMGTRYPGSTTQTKIIYPFNLDGKVEVRFKKSGSGSTASDYTIKASAGRHGSITPSGNVGVSSGDNKTFKISAESGYQIDELIIDGRAVSSPQYEYTFTNVKGNHTIEATFMRIGAREHTIKATTDGNGSISPSGTRTVVRGADQRFTFDPDRGYVVDDVVVDGRSQGARSSYTFTNVTDDHTIKVYFRKDGSSTKYTVTAAADSHGKISPSGSFQAASGSRVDFKITPDDGYKVDKVLVNGANVGAVTSYSVTVNSNVTVIASFSKKGGSTGDLRITDAYATSITKNSAKLVVKVAGASGSTTIRWESRESSGFKTLKNSNKATFSMTGLKADTTYTVRCIVVDSKGNTVTSATISFTTASGGTVKPPKGDYPCTGTVTGGSVYVRSGPETTKSKVTTLHKGDKVTVVAFSSSKTHAPGFYKIKWGSGYAYIAANYVKL